MGSGKAFWSIFVIIVPFLGTLVYLIAHGSGMAKRDIKIAQDNQAAFDSYVRQTAGSGTSSADELTKLADLKNQGVITDAEFTAQKAKLLADEAVAPANRSPHAAWTAPKAVRSGGRGPVGDVAAHGGIAGGASSWGVPHGRGIMSAVIVDETEVAIVGAGPAGLVLAHLLAARASTAVVLEQTRPRVHRAARAGRRARAPERRAAAQHSGWPTASTARASPTAASSWRSTACATASTSSS